jgi:hypothetical protein
VVSESCHYCVIHISSTKNKTKQNKKKLLGQSEKFGETSHSYSDNPNRQWVDPNPVNSHRGSDGIRVGLGSALGSDTTP